MHKNIGETATRCPRRLEACDFGGELIDRMEEYAYEVGQA